MKVMLDVERSTKRIYAYVSFEISNGDFLKETPVGSLARLMRNAGRLVPRISALCCFPESLHSQRVRRIGRQIIQQFSVVGNMVKANSNDPVFDSEATTLVENCTTAISAIDTVLKAVAAKYGRSE